MKLTKRIKTRVKPWEPDFYIPWLRTRKRRIASYRCHRCGGDCGGSVKGCREELYRIEVLTS